MIESRLDPRTDGTDGDYGNDPGLTIAEVARRFRLLAVEHHPGSVSSALRIVREQSRGRQSLTGLVTGSLIFSALYALIVLVTAFSPDRHVRQTAGECALGMLLLAGPIVVGTIHNRERISRGHAQLREMHRLALESLDAIVASPWFVPKPLDKEERKTLLALRKAGPEVWDRVAWILMEGSE